MIGFFVLGIPPLNGKPLHMPYHLYYLLISLNFPNYWHSIGFNESMTILPLILENFSVKLFVIKLAQLDNQNGLALVDR